MPISNVIYGSNLLFINLVGFLAKAYSLLRVCIISITSKLILQITRYNCPKCIVNKHGCQKWFDEQQKNHIQKFIIDSYKYEKLHLKKNKKSNFLIF